MNSISPYLLISVRGGKAKFWSIKWPLPLFIFLSFVHMMVDLTDFLGFFTPRGKSHASGYHCGSKKPSLRTINSWLYCIYAMLHSAMRSKERYELLSIETEDAYFSLKIK